MHRIVLSTVVGCVSRKNYWLLYGTVAKRRGLSGSKFQTYRSDAFLNKIAPSTIPTSQKRQRFAEYFFGQETLSQ